MSVWCSVFGVYEKFKLDNWKTSILRKPSVFAIAFDILTIAKESNGTPFNIVYASRVYRNDFNWMNVNALENVFFLMTITTNHQPSTNAARQVIGYKFKSNKLNWIENWDWNAIPLIFESIFKLSLIDRFWFYCSVRMPCNYVIIFALWLVWFGMHIIALHLMLEVAFNLNIMSNVYNTIHRTPHTAHTHTITDHTWIDPLSLAIQSNE